MNAATTALGEEFTRLRVIYRRLQDLAGDAPTNAWWRQYQMLAHMERAKLNEIGLAISILRKEMT